MLEFDTPHGQANVHLHRVAEPRAALVLGHGAGGGVGAPDLVAATAAAHAAGVTVALVEQPYRVAGRRSPAPAAQLDTAWVAVVEQLRDDVLRGLPVYRRRPFLRRARRLPHRRRDRRRGSDLPRVPASAAGARVRTEPAARARRGDRADARRPGRGRPVRDAAAVEAAVGRRRAGQSQPPRRRARARGRAGLAFTSALTVRTYVRVETRRRSCTPTWTRSSRPSSSGTSGACAGGLSSSAVGSCSRPATRRRRSGSGPR